MNSEEIRKSFLDFFEKKGHKIIPYSSLITDDPSVLFTTSGMQQFKKYYIGEKSPYGNNVASAQKCFRTSDIDSVGDESHLTFFEMLGNFSFGGYFKKEAIKYAYEFIVKELGLKIDYVTVFDPKKVPIGDWRRVVPFDKESTEIWEKLGVRVERAGIDNFWGPTGEEGPCGPTTEIYIKGIEIWNIVFNEYYSEKSEIRNQKSKLRKLETPGVDTGMGLERLVMMVQEKKNVFETDLFESIIDSIPGTNEKAKRIIADHIKSSVFLISEGILPSNVERGYVLRRILRRAIRYGKLLNLPKNFLVPIVKKVIDIYPEIKLKESDILATIQNEEVKLGEVLITGSSESTRVVSKGSISVEEAFRLYESLGMPLEFIEEIVEEKGAKMVGKRGEKIDREQFEKDFNEAFKKHQEISRAGAEKKFGGHGLKEGTKENQKIIRLHTATHLLQWALREVLGKEVKQMGSDINPERLRFDFNFSRKLTAEEIEKIANLVNEKIREKLTVSFKEMSKKEAEKIGALAFFKQKYGEMVKIYFIGPEKNPVSKEFCAGPHVKNTGEIGEFKILKEEAVGAGLRRIRADVK